MQDLARPTVVVNFKSNQRGCGDNAVHLARALDNVQRQIPHVQIVVAVQPQDIYRVSQETNLVVFAQHVDPISFGNYSGHICPEAIKEAGAHGTLLNHPEKRLPKEVCRETVQICQRIGLMVLACASSVEEVLQVEEYHPDYIGLECVSLIGTPSSLFDVCPGIVDEAIAQSQTPILFGAGIKTSFDVQRILARGGSGVMVSSAILKASDPAEALCALLNTGLITV